MKRKTAVLIHGYNINEKNWEQVVWGSAPNDPGRIPIAIATVMEEDADFLFLFNSSRRKKVDGVWVSGEEQMIKLLLSRLEQLPRFALYGLRNFSLKQIREKIKKTLRLEEAPQKLKNTWDELEQVRRICERWPSIKELYLISSSDHVSRIIRDAQVVLKGLPLSLYVRGGSTLYTKGDGITPLSRASVKNVAIAEPRSPISVIVPRLFRLEPEALSKALSEIEAVLKKYEKQKN